MYVCLALGLASGLKVPLVPFPGRWNQILIYDFQEKLSVFAKNTQVHYAHSHAWNHTHIDTLFFSYTHLLAPVQRQWSSSNVSNLIQERLITYVSPYKCAHLFSFFLSISVSPLSDCIQSFHSAFLCRVMHPLQEIDLFYIFLEDWVQFSLCSPSLFTSQRVRAFQSGWILDYRNDSWLLKSG